jgi:predicted glycoside hydrolase/deacetylase ChbG (UPF0249 family)
MKTNRMPPFASQITPPRTIRTIVMIALIECCLPSLAIAETWAEKLRYPAGKKVVIVYATQMGVCHEANEAGRELLDSGAVQSATAMPPCPWFGDFAASCRNEPGKDVGVAITLTSEKKNYRWRPIAPASEVTRLVDANGYLAQSVMQFTYNATPEQVETEIEAQIAHAKKLGLNPTHISPHLGAVFARPDVMAVYLATARKHWIPAVVIELTPEMIAEFRSAGIPLDPETIDLVERYPLPKLDNLRFTEPAESYEEKKANFLKLLAELEPGITQIMVFPAKKSRALQVLYPNWKQRVWEAKLLADAEVMAALQSEEIVLTNWKEMMSRFDPTAADAEDGVSLD